MSPEALAIRAAAVERFDDQIGAAPKLFRYSGAVPVEQEPDDQLPSLLVIVSREAMSADGDVGAGEPTFHVDMTLQFLISLSGKDREKADERISTRIAVVYALLNDPSFVSMFEGVVSMTATRMFDKDGERFFARAIVEMTVRYWLSFPPVIPDADRGTTLTVRPLTAVGDEPTITVTLDESDPLP